NFAAELTAKPVTTPSAASIDARFAPDQIVVKAPTQSAEDIVDYMLSILVDGDVPMPVRLNLYDFMNPPDKGVDTSVPTATKIDTKVRGLADLILSLPEYQMN